jgi:hypothetical protein
VSARRFRLEPAEPLELDIHESAARTLDRVLAPPVEWCCYPAGHIELSPAEVMRLQRVGLKPAYPDIWIFYRKIWGIELKRRGGELSKSRWERNRRGKLRFKIGQEEMFPRLLATGCFGAIETAYSVDQALDWIERWGIPMRGRIMV